MDLTYRNLLEDLSAHPERYSVPLMRRLLGERMDSAFSGDPDSPAGRFLLSGHTLEPEILVQEGLLPDISFRFVQHMRHQMQPVKVVPKKFTEVYLIGQPGAGKTAVLSGVLSSLYEHQLSYPRCTTDAGQLDRSAENCLELIRGLRDHFFPVRADKPFVRFNMSFAAKPQTGWSFVDLRARDIQKLTEFKTSTHGLSSIDPSLLTRNRKCLLFVVDTEAWLREELDGVVDEQGMFLVKALTILSNDGPSDRRPTSGCTFSRISSVAIVLAKADYWDSRIPSGVGRTVFFLNKLKERMQPFMTNLEMLMRKYNINRKMSNSLNVMPFSLGTLKVGNLVEYVPADSDALMRFLIQDRRQRKIWERLV